MSTKCSMAHGPDFHLYNESFDEEHVFLRLNNVEFEATGDGVTVKIPLHIWEFLRSFPGADFSDASKTDADIRREAIEAVDDRLAAVCAAKDSPAQSLIALEGSLVMGAINLPRDKQIANYVEYHRHQRSRLQEVLAQVVALRNSRSK